MAVAGTIVYKHSGSDYGLAKIDSRNSGIEHFTVTLDENVGGSGFTVPVRDLEYADGSRKTIEHRATPMMVLMMILMKRGAAGGHGVLVDSPPN